jgi:hypothetical protein
MNYGRGTRLSILLCSAPGLVVAGAALIGIAVWGAAFVNSPLGLGLITLAVLACPLNMVLTMIINRRQAASGHSSGLANCCMPEYSTGSTQADSSADRLAVLRKHRAALEHELAELQQS